MMILNWMFLVFDIFMFIVIANNVIDIHTQKKWNRNNIALAILFDRENPGQIYSKKE